MGSTAALALLLLLAATRAVFAVTFLVGDTTGWNGGVDYTVWASGKVFRVGDTLEFQYGPSHSVSVVDKAGFDSCDGSAATQIFSGGDTKILLTRVGTMHFLCPSFGHCLGGMKLAVPVLAAPSNPATPSPPPPSPRSPPPSPLSPPLAPRSPPPSPLKPKTPPPSASPPENGTPETKSSMPSPSPLTPTPSPSRTNVASKGVFIGYDVIGITMVLMYCIMT
ncbi:unnamed protein product [Cochlearia groenlandica]